MWSSGCWIPRPMALKGKSCSIGFPNCQVDLISFCAMEWRYLAGDIHGPRSNSSVAFLPYQNM